MNLIRRRKASNQTEKTSASDSKTTNEEENDKNKKAVTKKKKDGERGSKWSCIDSCCWFIGFICTVWWFLLLLYNAMPASFPQFVTEAIMGPLPDPPGVKLSKEGLTAKHPVVFVPGIVTSGLELWEGHQRADGLFRKRLWGGTFGELYKRLYQASLSGDVDTLSNLIKENPRIIENATVGRLNQTPLHIAASFGHLEFTRALLTLNTNLVNKFDSCGCSPLHLASDKGQVEIVRELLHANNDVCFHGDKDGKIPLHLAVMRGKENVILELIGAKPESAMVLLDKGETILHLCVRYDRLEALKLLLDLVTYGPELVKIKSTEGNTILHAAAALQRVEIMEYLLSIPEVIEIAKERNQKGFTVLDEFRQFPIRDSNTMKIQDILLKANVQRSKDFIEQVNQFKRQYFVMDDEWFKECRGHIITAATLIATVAFQAGIAPPGGVWQDDTDNENGVYNYHEAGTSIIARKKLSMHFLFVLCNTISFVASLLVIHLLLTGIYVKSIHILAGLHAAMLISTTSMALTYSLSIHMMIPSTEENRLLLLFFGYCPVFAMFCGCLFGTTVFFTYDLRIIFGDIMAQIKRQVSKSCKSFVSMCKPAGPACPSLSP